VKKKSTYIKKSSIQIKVGNYIEYRKEPNMTNKENQAKIEIGEALKEWAAKDFESAKEFLTVIFQITEVSK
jgi:hypothetical protein